MNTINNKSESIHLKDVATPESCLDAIIQKFGYESVAQFSEVVTSPNVGLEILVSDLYLSVSLKDNLEVLAKKLNYKNSQQLVNTLENLGLAYNHSMPSSYPSCLSLFV